MLFAFSPYDAYIYNIPRVFINVLLPIYIGQGKEELSCII